MWKQLILSAALLALGFLAGWKTNAARKPPIVESKVEASPPRIPIPTKVAPSIPEEQTIPLGEDPSAEELLAALKEDWEDSDSPAVKALAQLIATDPASALTLINQSNSEQLRGRFLDEIYRSWILLDPDGAIASAWAQDKKEHPELFEIFGEVLAAQDPENALSIGRELREGVARNLFLSSVFDALFIADPTSAASRLAEFPGARLYNYGRINPDWTGIELPELNGEFMDDLVAALPPDRVEDIIFELFNDGWHDRDERIGWALSLPKGSLRRKLVDEILWTTSYSESLSDKLVKLDLTSDERLRFAINRSAAIAAVDPQIGLENAATIDDPQARSLAERSVFGTWMANDPSAAIEFLITERPTELDFFATDVSLHLLKKPAHEAIAAALEIAATSGDSGLLTNIFAGVAAEDITLASSQVANLPAGPDRDAGIIGILGGAHRADPASSMQWALAIGDEGAKEEHVIEQFSNWAARSPSSAQAWLDASENFTPGQQAEMGEIVQRAHADPSVRTRGVTSGFGTVRIYY